MRLEVPGAELYYELRGDGPLLLISESGDGDARRSTDLVDELARDFTVLTYDRRGLSRSTFTGPVSIASHADDVHRLLLELTDEPVRMLGCSLGAVIGLHLAAAHPEQVSTLVAHEPVAPWLLPEPDRAEQVRELRAVQATYEKEGLGAAMKLVAEILGIDPHNQDTEPDLTPHPFDEQRIANFGFFLERDLSAICTDDAVRLPADVRIVPAAGRTTPRTVFDYRCAVALGELVGTPPVEFPGGHNGNLTHPRGYAATLRQHLA